MTLLSHKKTKSLISAAIVTAICGCSLLTGILPQAILSITVVTLIVLLAFTGEMHLAFPIMVFYYASFGMIFGVSVYRIYSMVFLGITWITRRDELRIQPVYMLLVFIYTFYAIAVVGGYNLRLGVFNIVDVLCAVTLTEILRTDKGALKRFFIVYTIIALCSYCTGIITGNSIEANGVYGKEFVTMSRFQATFEDPNYMGFFFTIAIFSILTLELFSKKQRTLIIFMLYAMLLSSLSITAIIVNILLWAMYLCITKQMNAKTLSLIFIVCLIAGVLYLYGAEHRASVFGSLAYRIEEKLAELSAGNINGVTTSRLELQKGHLEYFLNQPVYKQLFGGNLVTSSIILLDGSLSYSAHNEYVDELLNVGIAGECILIGFVVIRCLKLFKNYRVQEKKEDLCILIIKMTWLIYMTSLTVFMDFKYMFAYFM